MASGRKRPASRRSRRQGTATLPGAGKRAVPQSINERADLRLKRKKKGGRGPPGRGPAQIGKSAAHERNALSSHGLLRSTFGEGGLTSRSSRIGNPPLYGSASWGYPREARVRCASRAPAATLAAACALHASIPIPALKSVKKSSGYQHRSPERLAALAAAACRPVFYPALPKRELISEPLPA